MKPDRVVIGVRSQRPAAAMRDIYSPFNAPIIITDINSAELIKHAANSFLALKISYINAISVICESSGANVQEVAAGMGWTRASAADFSMRVWALGAVVFQGPERVHQDLRTTRLRLSAAQRGSTHQRRPDGAVR